MGWGFRGKGQIRPPLIHGLPGSCIGHHLPACNVLLRAALCCACAVLCCACAVLCPARAARQAMKLACSLRAAVQREQSAPGSTSEGTMMGIDPSILAAGESGVWGFGFLELRQFHTHTHTHSPPTTPGPWAQPCVLCVWAP